MSCYDDMLVEAQNKLVAVFNDPSRIQSEQQRLAKAAEKRRRNKPRKSRAMAAREGVTAPGVPHDPAEPAISQQSVASRPALGLFTRHQNR